jgi:hypothetical protein
MSKPVQFDARLRPNGSEQRRAGHQVIERHGRRIGLQADDAANQAIFERDCAAVRAEGCPGGKRLGVNQPVSRVREIDGTGKGCRQ